MSDNILDCIKQNNIDKIKLLLAHGADVNFKDEDGYTPLGRASRNGRAEIVKLLLAHDADVNVKNYNGNTPLYWASYNGHSEIVKVLLAHGADVNAKNCNGNTALRWVSVYGRTEIVKLLIDHGAKFHVRSYTRLHKTKSDAQIKGELPYTLDIFTKSPDFRSLQISLVLFSTM